MTEEIDYPAEYDNSARVENSNYLISKFVTDAAVFRETSERCIDVDLTYGPEPRNMLDIIWPQDDAGRDKTAPIVMFIHGGYWQLMDRSAFSHLAAGLNQNGIAVAMPSYTLCPDISIEGIINEIRRACILLHQTYDKKMTVIGHSAGGHLSACMMATDWQAIHPELPEDLVKSGMGISGIYDLLPLCQTPVNDVVGLDESSAHAASPIHWVPEALHRFEAWVGSEESSEYHRQSRELADRWSLLGTPTQYESVPAHNHFTVIDELINPQSPMVERIVDLSKTPENEPELQEPSEKEIRAAMQKFEDSGTESDGPKPARKPQNRKTKKASAESTENQPEQAANGD